MNRFAIFLYYLSTFSPFGGVWLFINDSHESLVYKWSFLILSIFIDFFSLFIFVCFIKKYTPAISRRISSIEINDEKYISVVLSYFLPVIALLLEVNKNNINIILYLISFVFLFISIRSVILNPLLLVLGYHSYKVSTPNMEGYTYVTRKVIVNKKQISAVRDVYGYFLFEV